MGREEVIEREKGRRKILKKEMKKNQKDKVLKISDPPHE